jgi:putative tricarboxylic transport membrane protein
VIGAFLINHNAFDVKMMFIFGIVGLALRAVNIPSAPFLLGVILGPMADANLRRALIISNGSLVPMFARPICLVFLVVIAVMILSQTGLLRVMKKALRRT